MFVLCAHSRSLPVSGVTRGSVSPTNPTFQGSASTTPLKEPTLQYSLDRLTSATLNGCTYCIDTDLHKVNVLDHATQEWSTIRHRRPDCHAPPGSRVNAYAFAVDGTLYALVWGVQSNRELVGSLLRYTGDPTCKTGLTLTCQPVAPTLVTLHYAGVCGDRLYCLGKKTPLDHLGCKHKGPLKGYGDTCFHSFSPSTLEWERLRPFPRPDLVPSVPKGTSVIPSALITLGRFLLWVRSIQTAEIGRDLWLYDTISDEWVEVGRGSSPKPHPNDTNRYRSYAASQRMCDSFGVVSFGEGTTILYPLRVTGVKSMVVSLNTDMVMMYS
ncbi:hypothetical protein KIPB_001240 [Kipferlia bialata]|uniref:Uncharacterized protein n=1 Tax=Kipferlia bialata TaxID=797122 RepID=A0A9K3CQE2_9EUKA|nr:hypothetical protein KIPB_001240 [Kipferlia bialata]|eukprot:g1240.t1